MDKPIWQKKIQIAHIVLYVYHRLLIFIASLNQLQYKDGYNILNLGRDDQAGFRLYTMTTHKLHSTLSIKGSEPLRTYRLC